MFPFPFGFIGSGEVIPDLELISNDYAMEFDAASSQYVTGNINTPSTFTNLTVSCWVNVDSFAALQNGILSSSTTSGVNDYEYGFALEVRNDNKFRCKIGSGVALQIG